jgi:RNA-directed DNA polymerase
MVFILKPGDNEVKILAKIRDFLAGRGMKVSKRKTQVTATP